MAKSAAIIALVASGIIALWGGITVASQLGGGTAGPSGSYPVDLNVQQDPCGHDQFIFASPTGGTLPHNMTLNVVVNGSSVMISGPSPWVTVNGTLTGNQVAAQGSGTVAGHSQVSVGFEGILTGGQIGGKYAFGAHGELPATNCPGGTPQPAVYTVQPKATPTTTPTGTPQKLYSIIVLKLNDDTNLPLPGWPMNLYQGSGCAGRSINSLPTDNRGLADFTGLVPGTYSVQEKMQPGWNPDGPVCQDVTISAAAGPAAGTPPPCPSPNLPSDCDSFFSFARVNVRLNGTTTTYTVNLSGPTEIKRSNKPSPSQKINTQIVFMKLTGSSPFGPVTVRQSPTRPSLGSIQVQPNVTVLPGTPGYHADSFFDVFFEVAIPGAGTLHNEQAFHIQCKITSIPPYLCFYLPPVSTPIPLLNADGVKIATLTHAMHIPLPPNEKLIIFSNRPKVTPTITPTPPNETPSPTHPPQETVTPTITPTPTVTATPTQPQVQRSFSIRCSNEFTGIKFTGTATITEKKRGQDTGRSWSATCSTNGPRTASMDYKISRGAIKNYALTITTAGGTVTTCPQQPRVAATQNVRITCQFSPDGVELLDGETGSTTFIGDVNCDGNADPVDSALILQFVAALLNSLPCQQNADVNGDGSTNAIDSTIILQFSAALVHSLPPAVP